MKKLLVVLIVIIGTPVIFAQNVSITPGGITPALSGTYPRLSYNQILALPNPSMGDIAYDTTFLCLRVFNGTKWVCTHEQPDETNPNLTLLASAGSTTGSLEGLKVAVDASGNVYTTGYFYGNNQFGHLSVSSNGLADIFVAKYNNEGAIQWVQSYGGTANDYGNDIKLDASGNVYVVGEFSGTVNFPSGNLVSSGSRDIVLIKLNSNGVFQWVQKAGGAGIDVGRGITIDNTNDVYITGYFNSTATFGSTSRTSVGSNDIFIAKYNTTGVLQWVQSSGGTSIDIAEDIAIDSNGALCITGYFYGTINLGTHTLVSAGNTDAFIAKYDPVGISWSWAQKIGGTSFEYGFGITINTFNQIIVVGGFQGNASFSSANRTSVGSTDIFVANYLSNGSLNWVQTYGGSNSDYGYDVCLDSGNNIYVTGYFEGMVSFAGIPKNSNRGSRDIYVLKIDSNVNLSWVKTAGGKSDEESNGVAVDNSGNIYSIGYFYDQVKFGFKEVNAGSNTDMFLVRLQE